MSFDVLQKFRPVAVILKFIGNGSKDNLTQAGKNSKKQTLLPPLIGGVADTCFNFVLLENKLKRLFF